MFKRSIGFTGTQVGMSEQQKKLFGKIIAILHSEGKIHEFHNGDCIGADFDACNIVQSVSSEIKIYIHPPIIDRKRAFFKGAYFTHKAKDYLDRNHDIVNDSDVLIATPKETFEQLRSGTWATIRYAKRRNKPVFLIHPDGNLLRFDKPIEKMNRLATILQ